MRTMHKMHLNLLQFGLIIMNDDRPGKKQENYHLTHLNAHGLITNLSHYYYLIAQFSPIAVLMALLHR